MTTNRPNRTQVLKGLLMLATIVISLHSLYEADQSRRASEQAVDIASSAFSIANFRPSVEVSGTTPLMLNVDCKLDKSRNVTCSFRGSFNVTFLIIAPHVGTYNISSLTLNQLGPFSPHPVSYFPGENGMSVKVGNITISTDPPLQMKPFPAGGAPAAQPFERTIVVEVTGLTVTVPSRMGGNLNVTGLGSALAILTYTDITTNTSVQRLFSVQVEIQISSA